MHECAQPATADRPGPSPRPPAAVADVHGLRSLQRSAGNRAVASVLGRAGSASLQRVGLHDDLRPPPGLTDLPDDLHAMTEAAKVAHLERLLDRGAAWQAVDVMWSSFGARELEVARAHVPLFLRSLERAGGIAHHPPVRALAATFERDVEAKALANLSANRTFVSGEMERLGTAPTSTGPAPDPTAEQDFAVQEVQRVAERLTLTRQAKAALRQIRLGTRQVFHAGSDTERTVPVHFDPAGPPSLLLSEPGARTWEQVKAEWDRVVGLEAVLMERTPAAVAMVQGELDPSRTATSDVTTARADIGRSLRTMLGHIEAAVPLVGDDLTFEDFPPLHGQLFAGAPAASGTRWDDPLNRALASRRVEGANTADLLRTLGVGALSAAAFVLAEFATAGLATFALAGTGIAIGVGQAAHSWDRYRDLSAAHAASVHPQLSLVSREQVDSAMIDALLDSVFVFADAAAAVRGSRAARFGQSLLAAGEEGLSAAGRGALRSLTRDAAGAAAVHRALAEIGPHELRAASGLGFRDLAAIAGPETEQGRRLLRLAEAPAEELAQTAARAADELSTLASLTDPARQARILQEALDQLGYVETLRRAGGWQALMATGVGHTAAARRLEAWRAGLVQELNEFVRRESAGATSSIRSGTAGAASDLDVQTVGGAAATMQARAEAWLGGRLGTSADRAKTLLHADIFNDPLRAHLQDTVAGLSEATRAAITRRGAAYERQMVLGARLADARAFGEDAVQRVIADARAAGVEPWQGFRALDPGQQQQLARRIDAWVVQLERTTDEAAKAELVEEVARAQAMINASHPTGDAYVGGGVRIWVSEREGDVFSEGLRAAGITMRTGLADEQRVVAALSEGRWLEAALSRLAAPGSSPETLAKAVKDLGKHGERATQVLRVPGRTDVARLQALGERLHGVKEMHGTQTLLRRVSSPEELQGLRAEIEVHLNQLRADVHAAVDALGADARALQVSPADMDRLQHWLRWEVRFQALGDSIGGGLAAWAEGAEAALRAGRSPAVHPSADQERGAVSPVP